MNEKHSLLNEIRSIYILKDILTLAFKNMKSVLKFVAYDKTLIKRLDINIKDYYDYSIKTSIERGKSIFKNQIITELVFIFIPFTIYYIMFFKKKTFDQENLNSVYNKNMKNFVDIIDKYVALIYLVFLFITKILLIIYEINDKIVLKRETKNKIEIIHFLIYLSFLIIFILKIYFIKQIIKTQLSHIWFGSFNIAIIIFIFLTLLNNFIFVIITLSCCDENDTYDDKKSIILKRINEINICDFKLPLEFDNLNEKGKLKMIFKEENMKKYKYKINYEQFMLLNKINQIRRNNNLPILKFYERNESTDYKMGAKYFSDFINIKTELIFYKEKNIYKFSNDYYLIKYPISESQKDINDKNIINIITIDFLDRINIIRINDYEYISLYKSHNEQKNHLNLPSDNNANTEGRLNGHESINLSSAVNYNDDNNDINGNSNIMIRNLEVKKIPFEKHN